MQRYKRRDNTPQKPVRKAPKSPKQPGGRKDLAMNIVILVLSFAVIYLGYSLYDRIMNKPVEIINTVTGEPIRVEVLNGCGVNGLAGKMTDYLRDQGFDVVKTDNAEHSDFAETIIQDRAGNMENAQKVANALKTPVDNIIQQINEDLYLDVTIIIGKNYQSLKPFLDN